MLPQHSQLIMLRKQKNFNPLNLWHGSHQNLDIESTKIQCKLVVNIKKWVDINEYIIQVCLHKIGARLLGKLTICIDNAALLVHFLLIMVDVKFCSLK